MRRERGWGKRPRQGARSRRDEIERFNGRVSVDVRVKMSRLEHFTRVFHVRGHENEDAAISTMPGCAVVKSAGSGDER